MARFDIDRNPTEPDRFEFPFVLEIQNALFRRFSERVCIPLARDGAIPGLVERLNPTLTLEGQTLRLHPLGIAVFFVQELRERVGTAKLQALQIETALDMWLRG